jgi:DNA-binding PadR family transcriptional regulator
MTGRQEWPDETADDGTGGAASTGGTDTDTTPRRRRLRTDGGSSGEPPARDAPAGGARGSYTLFQLEILYAIAHIEAEGSEAPYGLAIKRELEQPYRFAESINHGRLYPNLDSLVEQGLLEKGQLDDRTNEYRLTGAGRTFLADIVADRLYDLGRGEAPAWRVDDG